MSWALPYAMMMMVESTYVVFLLQFMWKREIRKSNRSWETPAADEVLRKLVMQSADTYIDH